MQVSRSNHYGKALARIFLCCQALEIPLETALEAEKVEALDDSAMLLQVGANSVRL